MLFLLLAATIAAQPPRPVTSASARASIRILQPARASEALWKSARRRTERLIVDEQGRSLRLRTIDFE